MTLTSRLIKITFCNGVWNLIRNVLLVSVMGRQSFCDVGVAFLALFCLFVHPCDSAAVFLLCTEIFCSEFPWSSMLEFSVAACWKGWGWVGLKFCYNRPLKFCSFSVSNWHTHTHTHTHMWVSRNVKLINAVGTKNWNM